MGFIIFCHSVCCACHTFFTHSHTLRPFLHSLNFVLIFFCIIHTEFGSTHTHKHFAQIKCAIYVCVYVFSFGRNAYSWVNFVLVFNIRGCQQKTIRLPIRTRTYTHRQNARQGIWRTHATNKLGRKHTIKIYNQNVIKANSANS